jgi:hypothetical protein
LGLDDEYALAWTGLSHGVDVRIAQAIKPSDADINAIAFGILKSHSSICHPEERSDEGSAAAFRFPAR